MNNANSGISLMSEIQYLFSQSHGSGMRLNYRSFV